MLMIMACWTLTMLAAPWAPSWGVGIGTLLTALSLALAHPHLAPGAAGGLQALVMLGAPWLLRMEAARMREALRRQEALQQDMRRKAAAATQHLRMLQDDVQRRDAAIIRMADVYQVTKATSGALHWDEMFAAFAAMAPRLLHASTLRLIDLSRATPRVFRAEASAGAYAVVRSGAPLPIEQRMAERPAPPSQTAAITAADAPELMPKGADRITWAGLSSARQPIGALAADNLPEAEAPILAIIANQLALQGSRVMLYEEVEALAVTDSLTGLSVRRHFLARAKEEIARSQRHNISCTLLMIDLDHFKQKNDTYGHLVGDVVLQQVAWLLQRHLRDIDLLGRYGGEEFVLLLVETPLSQALAITERLRQLVETTPIRAYDEMLRQTVSIGMAALSRPAPSGRGETLPEHATSLEELIERADQAMYAAKRAGRNRVVAWSPDLALVAKWPSG